MASNMRLLLRLPPAIRQQVLTTQPFQFSCSTIRSGFINGTPARSFSIISRLSKQGSANKTTYKNALPQAPKPQAKNIPKPQPTPPPAPPPPTSNALPSAPPPARRAPAPLATPAPRTPTSDWLSARYPGQDRVVLYVAPSHRAFFISSYLAGIFLFAGAFSYAQMFLKDPPEGSQLPKTPFAFKIVGAVSTLFVVAFATTFVLAPLKVLKSITAVRSAQSQVMNSRSSLYVPWRLQIEIKSVVPFRKSGAVIECDPADVKLDRSLPAASSNIQFTSWYPKGAEVLTQRYEDGTLDLPEGSALSRLNRSFLNTWPAIKRDVKRMFMRDQMAYVRVAKNGNFKLDMQESHMLDGGQVLDKIVGIDADAKAGSGWRSFLVRTFGDRNPSPKKKR